MAYYTFINAIKYELLDEEQELLQELDDELDDELDELEQLVQDKEILTMCDLAVLLIILTKSFVSVSILAAVNDVSVPIDTLS